MLEVKRVSFFVRIDEHQVEWGRSRSEVFDSFCTWAEDNVDLVDETRGGEVLRCHFGAMRVYF